MVQSFVESLVEYSQRAKDAMTSQEVEGLPNYAKDEEKDDELSDSRAWSANAHKATRVEAVHIKTSGYCLPLWYCSCSLKLALQAHGQSRRAHWDLYHISGKMERVIVLSELTTHFTCKPEVHSSSSSVPRNPDVARARTAESLIQRSSDWQETSRRTKP